MQNPESVCVACEKFEDANEVEIVRIINKGW